MKRIRTKFLSFFFPQRCLFCRQIVPDGNICCENCADKLKKREGEVKNRRTEGRILYGNPFCRENCGDLIAPFYNEKMVQQGIYSFKFKGERHAASLFADYMERELLLYGQPRWDLIVSVPMTALAKKKRGYNSAECLAKELSVRLSVPFCRKALKKKRGTQIQHYLNFEQRLENVRGAYRVLPREEKKIKGKRILLVDDIVTTGATADEIAKVLLSCGAQRVDAVFAALTR